MEFSSQLNQSRIALFGFLVASITILVLGGVIMQDPWRRVTIRAVGIGVVLAIVLYLNT